MAGVLSAGLVVLLAAWLAATVVAQLPLKAARRLRGRDPTGLIPRWSFFAPTPGTSDYCLVTRDRLADGSLTPWTERCAPGVRRWHHAVWNPRRRETKALFDLVQELTVMLAAGEREELVVSVAYLVLLNTTSALPRDHAAVATQFAVIELPAAQPRAATPFLLSSLHRLDPSAAPA